MVSESGEIIARIVARGHNYQTIAQVIGVDRSLIRRIRLGQRPAHNLRAPLAELEQRIAALPPGDKAAARRLQVSPHTHRMTKAGEPARVRRKTTHSTVHAATSTVKKSGARNGARSLTKQLGRAAEGGHTLAVTIGVDKKLTVLPDYRSNRAHTGAGGAVDMALGSAERVAAAVRDEYDGNLSAYVAAKALERGLVSGAADAAGVVAHLTSLELRSWEPEEEEEEE